MHGNNPIRPPTKGDGTSLDVKHIFLTVQGEGPNTGQRAIFIRLGGCNLACSFCDTDFEDFQIISVASILEKVNELSGRAPILVVITGGEPLRQPIELLCSELTRHGYRIQLETNGTLYRPLPEGVEIICSPKNTGNGYHPIREDLLTHVTAFKFIVSATQADYNHVTEVGQKKYNTPVYVQPMDEYDALKNRKNLQLAIGLALSQNYRLSLQTHKLAGLE